MPSYTKFCNTLATTYHEEITLFWQEQYSLYASGYRGVKLHDITLVELSR